MKTARAHNDQLTGRIDIPVTRLDVERDPRDAYNYLMSTLLRQMSEFEVNRELRRGTIEIRCKKHPQYRAKGKPRGKCVGCWTVWWDKTRRADLAAGPART